MTAVRTAPTNPNLRTGPPTAGPREIRPGGGAGLEPAPLARLAGLDGMRAIAVAAVVVFHLRFSALPGGFLGVDVFFVISGFLITRLLLTEVVHTGTLRLGRFYVRRARRLLPGLIALMLCVTVAGTEVWRDQLSTLRGSVLSSLGYVTNWWLISDHQSYFAVSGRPPMLQHLWSLAIEEQYYLIWSAVIVLSTAAIGRLRWPAVRRVAVIAAVLTIASTATMAVLAILGDIPYGTDSSRVYFGTDTHSMGLLLGSIAGACSVGLDPLRLRRPVGRLIWLSDAIAVAALAALAWTFTSVNEFEPWLYRGGFLAVDALALTAVLATVRPGSMLGRLLESPLPKWIGRRSYGIYLWHWPVAVVTRPGIDVHGPPLLLDAARVGLILALAAASYRFIERPVRERGLGTPAAGPDSDQAWGRALPSVWGVAVASCVLTLLITGYTAPTTGGQVAAGNVAVAPHRPPVWPHQSILEPSASPSRQVLPSPSRSSSPEPARPVHTRARTTPPAHGHFPTRRSVSAFGDSVMLGARSALALRLTLHRFDAVEGRQAHDVLADIDALHGTGALARVVVIHIGNNGIISPNQLTHTLHSLRDRRRVVLVNDRVSRDWQDPNNSTLREVSRRFANTTLVDWFSVSSGQSSWFYDDGLHLDPVGAAVYARVVTDAVLR